MDGGSQTKLLGYCWASRQGLLAHILLLVSEQHRPTALWTCHHAEVFNHLCWWGSLVAKSCPTLCDPIDCSLGFSVHRISQAKILEWVAISFSKPPLDCSVKGAIYIIKVSYGTAADLLTEVLTLISHWMLATRGRGTILDEAADCRWDNPSRCWWLRAAGPQHS